jgi:prepilin-type processing-associated H-X9-DG protein
MRNIALALQQYESRNGTLPPAYIADADGKPMHSWRVLLLPYLEQNALYRQYRFDEPWDGPNNSQLHGELVRAYFCPSETTYSPATNYVVVTGSQTIWPDATPAKLADITDGLQNTILLVEVHNSGIHWMEPRDLDIAKMPMAINAPKGVSISSVHHPAGFANVVFADGAAERIPNNAPAKALRAALTISGGEKDRLPTIRNRR